MWSSLLRLKISHYIEREFEGQQRVCLKIVKLANGVLIYSSFLSSRCHHLGGIARGHWV